MKRFRRGMTIAERRRWRAEILAAELERACRAAARHKLTATCIQALELTGSRQEHARGMHAACTAEKPGGPGCACPCHDVITGTQEYAEAHPGSESAAGGFAGLLPPISTA